MMNKAVSLLVLIMAVMAAWTNAHIWKQTLAEANLEPQNGDKMINASSGNTTAGKTKMTDVANTTSNTTKHGGNETKVADLPRTLPFPPIPFLRRNVAFSVRKAYNLQAVSRLRFQEVVSNIGGGWNHAADEFVAQYNGGYYFSFHAVGARNRDFTLALMKNGIYQVTAYGTERSFEHGSNSVFLDLHNEDRIFLELQQGSIYEHPGDEAYTTLTGFLLFEY
ncbi:cerebellin-2-like [Cherax quadricarinatus]|nr:complement C1q-like protein 4 isoform X2 [Cherax quadricarinatus]